MVVNRLEIRPVNFVNSTPTKKRDRQDLIYIYRYMKKEVEEERKIRDAFTRGSREGEPDFSDL